MHLLFPSVIFNLTEGKLIYLLAHNHYTYTNNRNSNIFFPRHLSSCLAGLGDPAPPFCLSNGMLLALMSLSWWFSMAREEKKLCVEALDDVCWMLEQMIAWMGAIPYHTAECFSGFWGYRLRTSCCWDCLYSAKWWGQTIENKFNLLIAIIVLLTFAAIVNDWRV